MFIDGRSVEEEIQKEHLEYFCYGAMVLVFVIQ